jgi:small subunit ribosomal protein S1
MSNAEPVVEVEPIDITWTMPAADADLIALLGAPLDGAEASGSGVGDVVEARVERDLGTEFELRTEDDRVVRVSHAESRPPGARDLPEVGSLVQVHLEEVRNDGTFAGSIGRAALVKMADALQAAARDGVKTAAHVSHLTRGGFAVEVMGVRGFMPGAESGIPVSDAEIALGRTFDVHVVRVDDRDLQPVVSRKSMAADEARGVRDEAFANFEVGQLVSGVVSSIRPFGAFVRLGPVEGLLHVSELSLENLDDPGAVLKVGDEVQARVIEVNAARGRLSLSRRELLMAAQEQKLASIPLGAVLTGTVRRLTDFGAFIAIEPGVEGLCHVSELSWTSRVSHPSEVLTVGQEVQVRVLAADGRRVALSLRAVEANPWSALLESTREGDIVEGTIRRIESYGLFVEVAPGIEGLAHISDLTWEGRPAKPGDVSPWKLGDALQVRVLKLDAEKRRISLGVKQLSEDPWDAAGDRLQQDALVTGNVTRLEDNAAWVQVAPGVEGRIHISEMSLDRVDSVRAAVRPGQEVTVMIVKLDRDRRRVDLSIKAVEAKIAAETPSSYQDSDNEPSIMAQALAKKGLVTES